MNALNGYPSIQTGSNKYFNLPSYWVFGNAPGFYFVIKPLSTANGALVDFYKSAGPEEVSCSVASPSATFTMNQGSALGSLTASSALSVGQYQFLDMESDINVSYGPFTTASIFTNGILDANGALNGPSWSSSTSTAHVGTDYTTSSNFFDGELLEVWNSQRNAANVQAPIQPNPYFLSRYQILNQNPVAPIISVPTGSLSGPTQVGISVPADCDCKFTVDGTTPTSASPSYSEPINIYYSQTLQAIAIKNGYSSSVASAAYLLDSTQSPSKPE